jgi:ATP-dependent helicase/nuclease subunit A
VTLADQSARHRIRFDLDTTFVVEAAAGTGKTSELVQRVLALVRTGKATLARLVAVTFTEKAAGEMKLRLRTEVERARQQAEPTERARFEHALSELEEAHIGTIHGFCAELLRQHPIEARVDPLFEGSDEDQQERLFDEAFGGWFQRVVGDPPSGVRRVLRHRQRGRDRIGPREILRRAGLDLVKQRDFEAPWRRPVLEREAEIDSVLQELERLGALASRAADPGDWCAKGIAELQRFVAEIQRREAIVGRDYDGLEEELRTIAKERWWRWNGRGRWFAKELTREAVHAQRQSAKDALDAFLEKANADLAACLREDLRPLVAEYDALKERAGKLDFLDLLLVTRALVRDDEGVRRKLQNRFTHVLVDEFQDTDPLQAELLLLLTADDPRQSDWGKAKPVAGKLFVVGDPKQAIYRFRRADVTLYERVKKQLVSGGAQLLHLTTSFRSVPSLQEAINAAFAAQMRGSDDGSQAEYVPLQAYRTDPIDRPTLVALPVPRPYSDFGKITNYSINTSFPDAVGALVDWLIRRSGWKVSDRELPDEPVAIEARHICLLTRRFVGFGEDLMRPYVRALEARRVPHVLVGGRSFHAREEVMAIRNALTAIEWPDDELSVFATLRGPFFALTDAALLVFRHRVGSLHPLRHLEQDSLEEIARPVGVALGILQRLHVGRNRRSIAETVAELLEATRAHAGIAIWPTGEQALANVLRVLDLARRFERAGATSFRAFVEWMEEEAERGAAAEAPVVEEGTEGVRIMTVHKAKGLEFPIVILIDPAQSVSQEPSRYIDSSRGLFVTRLAGCTPLELLEHRDEVVAHDMAESVRLTYVAATRARDLLVIPVVGDEAVPGWVDTLHAVVYPKRPRDPEAAAGCPSFGNDTVLERPSERDHRDGVMPGAHVAKQGTHKVVWWDPKALELGREEEAGLRQQRILALDEGGSAAQAGVHAHDAWREARKAIIERGSTPSLHIKTVTASDLTAESTEASVTVEASSLADQARPGGRRFGTLVHSAIAAVDLLATRPRVRSLVSALAQMAGATTEEKDAAVEAVLAALSHPLLVAAREAGPACHREAPVVLCREDGTLLEGVLDLAFRTTDSGGPMWIVVDYKTDASIEGRLPEYQTQVRSYVRAVAAATGERARGILFRV